MAKYLVETFDYTGLVEKMADAGIKKMDEVLNKAFASLSKPKWEREKEYFWKALFNAARKEDTVWLWLATQPQLAQYDPSRGLHTSGRFVNLWSLPEIGGPGDQLAQEARLPKQWSPKPTEANFLEQTEAFNQSLLTKEEKHPGNKCKTVWDYVATFYHSGSAQMSAKMQLAAAGFRALATQKGIEWLMKEYSPEKLPQAV